MADQQPQLIHLEVGPPQPPSVGWPFDYSGPIVDVLALLEAHLPPAADDDLDEWHATRTFLLERVSATKARYCGVFAQWKRNPGGRLLDNGYHLVVSFAEYEESPQ